MSDRTHSRARSHTTGSALVAALLALTLWAAPLAQQVLDICGCATGPNLGDVNLSDDATFLGVATRSGEVVTFPLPPDGVLRFESLRTGDGSPPQRRHMRFARNALNTPVTILVKGDMTMLNDYCCYNIDVGGGNASSGSSVIAGVGGAPGNGGFRGGDGAAPLINGAFVGGAGFGPGGGNGAVATTTAIVTTSNGGTFFGVPELLPLIGGSGGGGGAGTSAASSCTGGGGGGGAGGILIAVNGTLRLTNYDVFADGGNGGSVGNGSCARGGGGGSGGAIRMIAGRFASGGNGRIFARGGGSGFAANDGTPGRIRFETVDSSAQTTFSADPPAARVTGPSPIANPVQPTVQITSVGNVTPPNPPTGWQGAIDINLPAPGDAVVSVRTTGVPSGTTVEVKVKARIGADPVTATVPLTSCNSSGVCTASTNFNLAAGAYTVEARATFQLAP